ncbi:hypothetical protein SAMN02745194_03149 [Roseomonas rosea]|uniref:Uncharacterized protein n=1 Tax=Muricoccus roseus TaxID=198092 RepID=A0A1M6LEP2_9PROT|nr:hypothetical protein [Roseomonas rosea]SHJ69636.1 hypothetical protein SAMN02745194_03149 [Roseomonas rosea]
MTNIILAGSAAVIPNGAATSSGMDIRQRPLSWLLLPSDWPAGVALTVQAAVTETMPAAGSADWKDVVDRYGAAITLAGAAGQIIAIEPGLIMGFRWLRLKAAANQLAERSIQWGGWYL